MLNHHAPGLPGLLLLLAMNMLATGCMGTCGAQSLSLCCHLN
jgi:hypothetical protein